MTRLSPGVRFLLGILTFLLCVALFVTALAGILISNVTQIFASQENLEGLLRQVMFVDLKQPAPVRAISRGNAPVMRQTPVKTLAPATIRLSEQQAATSMVDWIYQALSEDFGGEMQIPLENIQNFVADSTIDDFLVEKGAGLLNDVYTGQSTVTLTPEEIQAQITQNAALIEEVFGVPVNEEMIANVTAVIAENEYVARLEKEGIVNVLLNISGADYDPSQDPNSIGTMQIIEALRTLLSPTTILILGGICLLLIGLLLLINCKQVWAGLTASGITLLVASLPAVILTVVVLVLPAGWSSSLGLFSIVEVLIRHIVLSSAAICIGVFVVGLVLIISGPVVKGAIARKYETAAATSALSDEIFEESPVDVTFPEEETEV